ncbi:NADH-quinone oxidoreductase subunit C [uncultured Methanoregula sp.]|uniref:hydrogenase large subunit n=1 Tax=uncultured Methanoregula sp. TaxID=1005933 RepID=UPI002AAA845B|nr:NADH-quinone oxidoreductase subunit C [uncultured Methanoregula sp.]
MTESSVDGFAAVREMVGSIQDPGRIVSGCAGEYYLTAGESEFTDLISSLSLAKCVLAGLFCVEGFTTSSRFSLFYVFERKTSVLVIVRNVDERAGSIARVFPSACWFERECRDGFGVEFEGAFDERRLFLHETYPDGFHPLKKSVKNIPIQPKQAVDPGDEYVFRKVSGEGVYQVPVGPVHAGIIEPGHFRFSVIGETVFNLEIRMFYKHRGIEKLAEGKSPDDCVRIAEAVSGDESVANATAFCMAAERIAGTIVPERAWYLRTILLELERICSHLGDQAGMLVDVAFPLGASQFSVLREEVFRMNAHLTGSRFLRGMICCGGLSHDISRQQVENLAEFVRQFGKRYQVGLKIVLSTTSVIDRFASTGVIKKNLILPLNLTGPAARASGGKMDVRIDHPYGIYDRFVPQPKPLNDGDVLSRFTVKASEIFDSLKLIEQLAASLPEGPVAGGFTVRDGHALSMVESCRGGNHCWILIRNGVVDRYKVRTASFCNWLAIEHAIQGNIVPDFPVINKSLNLSYAGTDL